jgi:hypothetical protein
MTPRLGGNSIAVLVQKSLGFDLVEFCISAACGDIPKLPPKACPRPTALILLGLAKAGKLCYDDAEVVRLRAEPWVDYLAIDVPMGDTVQPFINGRHRIGEAIVLGTGIEDLSAKVTALKKRLHLRAE